MLSRELPRGKQITGGPADENDYLHEQNIGFLDYDPIQPHSACSMVHCEQKNGRFFLQVAM